MDKNISAQMLMQRCEGESMADFGYRVLHERYRRQKTILENENCEYVEPQFLEVWLAYVRKPLAQN